MNKKLLTFYGLKFNPFGPDVPTESLYVPPTVNNFIWRVEHLAREGGFALIMGGAGQGKSVDLRLLVHRLSDMVDVKVGIINRPQSNLADFYREMGDLFGVQLTPNNRWNGTKLLRKRWQEHIEKALFRPLLVIDESQEMQSAVFTELRLLCSTRLDSKLLLTVVFAGDDRLQNKFRSEELLHLSSRIRTRLTLTPANPGELLACLQHLLKEAGNSKLMTLELQQTLCEHAAGNYRVLMTMAGELLTAALQRELPHLDEKLYFEIFAIPNPPSKSPNGRKRKRK